MTNSPRIAFLDVETAPAIIAAWNTYEASAVWVERNTFLLSFAIQWDGERKIKTYTLADFPGYESNKTCDRALCLKLHEILSHCSAAIAHNGDRFDFKLIRGRMLVHGLPPVAPFKQIDTLKIVRRNFKLDSARLDSLGGQLGCGRKLKHTGADLWRRCIAGDLKAWALMAKYNAQDVALLARVWKRIQPYANIDLRPYAGAKDRCPVCLSKKIQRRGVSVARSRRYQRYQCQDCGAWHSGEPIKSP